MNTLHTLKRSATRNRTARTSAQRPSARGVATLAPLALLAGLLLPATSAAAVQAEQADLTVQGAEQGAAPQAVATSAAAATDAAGNVIPPDLNAHVPSACVTGAVTPGTSGKRVQMLLIEEPGDLTATTRAEFIAELREEARYIDDAFAIASAETGNGPDNAPLGKRIRWSTGANDCTVDVRTVAVPTGTLGQNASTAMTAVQQNHPGLLTTDRIYLGFTAKTAAQPNMPSCGQTMTMLGSEQQMNNDGRTIQFARINHISPANGRTCHSVDPNTYDSTTLHELMHVLGATYPGAPGSADGSHCNDGYETLCEAQNDLNPKCEGRWVIDCGKDTYFDTTPDAGEWLAQPGHWNVANSPFLANVAQLPTSPAASITFDKATPVGNDVVTATVQTVPGAQVEWGTNACDYTDAPTRVTADSNGRATYTIQCYDPSNPTVSARVWRAGEEVVTRPKRSITYTSGPDIEINVSGPSSATPGQQVTLSASTNAPGDWTYEWFAGQDGCSLPVLTFPKPQSVTGQSVTVSCDGSLSNVTFWAEAVRAQDGKEWNGSRSLSITSGIPTGDLDIRLTGSLMATGGNSFTVAATNWTSNATIVGWSWSASHGCTAAPLAVDRSIAEVSCPTATNAQVTFTATGAASDGRTGSGVHRVTVVPGTPPPPPPPPPPTPPVSPKATSTDLVATPAGNNTTFTVTIKTKAGAPMAGQRVAIETRPRSGGAYTTIAWVTTAANGTATASAPASNPVFARAQFPGDATWSPSVSREVSVSAMIVVKAAKWGSKGLKATVKTTGGAAASKVVLALQKKVGNKWKKISSATTNTKGVAQVKMKVKSKTVFRFVASDSSTYRTDTSPSVTLRP